ncbi:MAG: alanine racemase [Planctomycetales bacterium 4572_13]|nr:MAG: alanine racemase [Planctomycetales bacterium 4572_13]
MRVYRSQQLIRPDLQAHIFSQNLLGNVRKLKGLCPAKTKFCAVVKANAYGHGISEIVNILKQDGVDMFAVATFYEALHVATMTQQQSIFILEPVNSSQSVEEIQVCAQKGFHCVLASADSLKFVRDILQNTPHALKVHLNIETGMGRSGIEPESARPLLEQIADCPNLKLAGIYTHFATADEEDLSYANEQHERFEAFLKQDKLRGKGILIHAANSAVTIKIPQAHYDMVRCGISMYGYYSRQMKNPPVQLTPVMKLTAPITHLKTIPAGQSVSYGQSFTTQRDTLAAIVPLGYADGYRRCFSNTAMMKVGHHAAPVIGRVCMDQVILDVTGIPDIQLGRIVTVLDNHHGSVCSAYALADLADTICYEILTSIHTHVNRIIH